MEHTSEDLLWTIQGKFGENLATAYLKWLLGNRELAAKFLASLSECTFVQGELGELGTLTAAHLEVGTVSRVGAEGSETPTELRGRLDMLIETDRSVIGVESKIHALFQDGQPEKYLDAIKQKAQQGGRKAILLILTPDGRRKTVSSDLQSRKISDKDVTISVLDWQSLLKSLNTGTAGARWEVELLSGYIANHCDPLKQVQRQMQSSSGTEQQSALGDADVQAQFLKAMVAFGENVPGLPDGKFVRNTKNYLVYEFDLRTEKEQCERVALFGFIDRKFYGLEAAPGTGCERAFVICHPEKLHRESNDGNGLVPAKKNLEALNRNRIKGIIRHAKEDGEVWVVPDQKLWDIVNSKEEKDKNCLAEWLAWVYPEA